MDGRLRKLAICNAGVSLIPYKRPAGSNSIGRGRNFDSHPLPEDIPEHLHEHGKIPVAMAERLLDVTIGVVPDSYRDLHPGFDAYSENRKKELSGLYLDRGCDRVSLWAKECAGTRTVSVSEFFTV